MNILRWVVEKFKSHCICFFFFYQYIEIDETENAQKQMCFIRVKVKTFLEWEHVASFADYEYRWRCLVQYL
jgi:hypothetical protein